MRYLIFRTDRIGDFLLTCILIKNIKFNDPNSFITIVCSNKNYDYIKVLKIDLLLQFNLTLILVEFFIQDILLFFI